LRVDRLVLDPSAVRYELVGTSVASWGADLPY
jgi:hypothetical protein